MIFMQSGTYLTYCRSKVIVGVLHPIQQPCSYRNRPLALSIMGVEPTHRWQPVITKPANPLGDEEHQMTKCILALQDSMVYKPVGL